MKLQLLDYNNNIIDETDNKNEVYLAYKDYTFKSGDKIKLIVDTVPCFVWVQLDSSLSPALIYLSKKTWTYNIITEDKLLEAYPPGLFSGNRHLIRAYSPTLEDITKYRNLALNSHDQKHFSTAYPHAFANVETRNESVFFARNAIDGIIANTGHGKFPYQSWGINQQANAALTIDFGRYVKIDKLALIFRGDYPHDSYWNSVSVYFSDNSHIICPTTNSLNRQIFNFPEKIINTITLTNLIKNNDDSPFPALTEIEVYGTEI